MPIAADRLHQIAAELASRSGHGKVRALVHELLVLGVGIPSQEIRLEEPLWEVRGRADALLGRTVIEVKSDLRSESADAEEKLLRSMGDRERAMGTPFVGIATDGRDFVPYKIRNGALRRLAAYSTTTSDPGGLLHWLSAAVARTGL